MGGDFDAVMRLVLEASTKLGLYLVNSINPLRIEGQKTIIWELLQDLDWNPPDWIVSPPSNTPSRQRIRTGVRTGRRSKGW